MKNGMKSYSLFFLPILALLIIFILAAEFIFQFSSAHYIDQLANEELNKIIDLSESAIQNSWLDTGLEYASQQFQSYFAVQKIDANVAFLDKDFLPIYSTDKDKISFNKLYSFYKNQFNNNTSFIQGSNHFSFEKPQYEVFIKKIDDGNTNNIEYIFAYTPLPAFDSHAGGVTIYLLVCGFVLTVFAFLCMMLASNAIVEPLRKLKMQADKMGGGHYSEISTKSGIKEVDDLIQTFTSMSQRLEQYDQAQKLFFQNSSHELKTPLTSIQGYAEGITHGIVEPKMAAKIIEDESKRLSTLVDRLMFLSKIDNVELKTNNTVFDMLPFIEQQTRIIKGFRPAQPISVHVHTNAESCIVCADKQLLNSAVYNMLANCARFCKQNIWIELVCGTENLILFIKDDGPGFEDKDLPYIFDRFYKGKGGQFGLGLSIALSSVEYMGGKLKAYNSQQGAVFELRLPRSLKQ